MAITVHCFQFSAASEKWMQTSSCGTFGGKHRETMTMLCAVKGVPKIGMFAGDKNNVEMRQLEKRAAHDN